MAASEAGTSLERRMGRLQEIVTRLESERLELQEALALFEEGVRELREAERLIKDAELRIERLLEEPDGSLHTEPLRREQG
jgi:exodeoxyribonuclease VII small subunit